MSRPMYEGSALFEQAKAIAIGGGKRAVARYANDQLLDDIARALVPEPRLDVSLGCAYCGTEAAAPEAIYCTYGCAYLKGFDDGKRWGESLEDVK